MHLKFKHSEPIPRAAELSESARLLAFGGRFADEILGGLPDVLMPTIRAQLGLSYAQISLLGVALDYVALVVEPAGGLLIDLWQRRWLMAWGAAAIGLAVALMGIAPTFLILLAGFALYGAGSGPLAHTADVVLVEGHPEAPDRIFARATAVDTVGALLAPLLVTLAFWLGLSWRWLMVGLGLSSLFYAALIWRTRFPPPANGAGREGRSAWQDLGKNVRAVLKNGDALSWMVFLLIFDVLEAPLLFKTVWLREQVGMSQALIGVYRTLELVISLGTLLYLDRWLARSNPRRILQTASAGLLILYPLWLLVPSVWTRFVLAAPLNVLMTVYWPIGRAQSLASAPGRGGTVSALVSLAQVVPLALLFGLLAEAITLTAAMLWVSVGALLLLLVMAARLPR